ncbi:MAG: hypothetical protein SNJ82_10850 [Gemmataceae bacterium]
MSKGGRYIGIGASYLIVILSLCGCSGGPKLVAVTGKASFKGQPLTAGAIYLHPGEGNDWKGDNPSSVLQIDGRFELRTPPHGAGAPSGVWKVTFSPALANRIGRPNWGDPQQTPLTLEIPEDGLKDYFIEIK